MFSVIFYPILYVIAGLMIMIFIVLLIDFYKERGQITRSLHLTLFSITLPKQTLKEQLESKRSEEEKVHIKVADQFFSSLFNISEKNWWKRFIYGDPVLVFEMALPNIGEEISFYVAAPRNFETIIEKQIHSFFPDALVEKAEDYNIFNPIGYHVSASLSLNTSYFLPILTFKNLEYDPLENISNALSKLEKEGEGAAIQLIIKKAPSGWVSKGQKIIKAMQEGKSFSEALKGKSIIGDIFNEIFISKEAKEKEKMERPKIITPVEEAKIKAISEKISKIGFNVNIRLIASAKDKERAQKILSHLEAAFQQFGSPQLNFFKFNRPKNRELKKQLFNFSFRIFNNKEKMLLNTEEIVSIFHFPGYEIAAPKIKWLKARGFPPPPDLPTEGIAIGKNIYRGEETLIRITRDDRRRHFYIIGQTGTGKSYFMQEMLRQDIENGEGVCLIDPHGDIAEAIFNYIPKERIEDVIYFNPGDFERPTGLNMLEFDERYPEQKTLVVNEMFSIFDKLYDLRQVGGPMFELYMKNAMLLVMEDIESGSTLMEIPKILVDEDFRHYKLSKTKTQTVYDFWTKEAEKVKGEASLSEIAPYITSKINMFIANDIMRPIISQQKSAFNFRRVMDEGKILIVNLSKGKLGDINAYLLGLIIVGKILVASLSRTDIPQEERRDFYLYIDEFQNFITDSISVILSESRKYRLNLIIAHQFLGQLIRAGNDTRIRDAIFGNVGSMAAFRVGPEDAEYLKKQFEPVVSETDLINLANRTAYLRLLIKGVASKPFDIKTLDVKPVDNPLKKSIIEYSRMKYGRSREEIEEEILLRTKKIAEGL